MLMINQAHNENGDVSTENRHTINQNRNHTKKNRVENDNWQNVDKKPTMNEHWKHVKHQYKSNHTKTQHIFQDRKIVKLGSRQNVYKEMEAFNTTRG